MSDKDRQKKDGCDKNKKNQARRKAEKRTGAKRDRSAHNTSADEQSRQAGAGDPDASASSRPSRELT
jgi:hypothetical protein